MFFEMDAMLSLHERPSIRVGQNVCAQLRHIANYKGHIMHSIVSPPLPSLKT